MRNTRVLIVDDSALIRALFCDVLDNARGIDVCGVAANADEARDKIAELRPDVLTLDNEMPGTSGLDFLAEVMAEYPTPVIMLSSLTQEGNAISKRAMELGAAYCFPKPISSARDEFELAVGKLAEIVNQVAQKGSKNNDSDADGDDQGNASYQTSGMVVVLVCGAAGIDAAKQVLASFPAQCPPTIMVFDQDIADAGRVIETMRQSALCEIEEPVDGMTIREGRALIVHGDIGRIGVESGDPPRLRLLKGTGQTRQDSLVDSLMKSLARRGIPALGGLLSGKGCDGVEGVQLLIENDNLGFVQRPPNFAPHDRLDAVRDLGMDIAELDQAQIPDWILEKTDKNAK